MEWSVSVISEEEGTGRASLFNGAGIGSFWSAILLTHIMSHRSASEHNSLIEADGQNVLVFANFVRSFRQNTSNVICCLRNINELSVIQHGVGQYKQTEQEYAVRKIHNLRAEK